MTEPLIQLIQSQAADLINANGSTIAQELESNPEGKLSVGITMKLSLVTGMLFASSSLSFSRKFNDDVQGSVRVSDSDPKQEKLFGKEAALV